MDFTPGPTEIMPISLAGDTLSGGGQTVRLAIGLSALTRTSIVIDKVRAGRPKGGLKRQHLAALQFLQDTTGSRVAGAWKGAHKVGIFYQAEIESPIANEPSRQTQAVTQPQRGLQGRSTKTPFRSRTLPCGTQVLETIIEQTSLGCIGLVFQALLPFLLLYPMSTIDTPGEDKTISASQLIIVITGGTNVPFSPSMDYIIHVLIPILERIGLPPVTAKVEKRGWSTGGVLSPGKAIFSVQPLRPGEALNCFQLVGCQDMGGYENHKKFEDTEQRKDSRDGRQCDCKEGRGKLKSVQAFVIGPKESEEEFSIMLESTLRKDLKGLDGELDNNDQPAFSIGLTFENSGMPARMYLLLVATCSKGYKFGRHWLLDEQNRGGQGGQDGDEVVSECVKRVVADLKAELETGGCVDEYAQDQLVIFQALSRGYSRVYRGNGKGTQGIRRKEPSIHTKTARWVVEEMLKVSFDVDGGCRGVGHVPGRA